MVGFIGCVKGNEAVDSVINGMLTQSLKNGKFVKEIIWIYF